MKTKEEVEIRRLLKLLIKTELSLDDVTDALLKLQSQPIKEQSNTADEVENFFKEKRLKINLVGAGEIKLNIFEQEEIVSRIKPKKADK